MYVLLQVFTSIFSISVWPIIIYGTALHLKKFCTGVELLRDAVFSGDSPKPCLVFFRRVVMEKTTKYLVELCTVSIEDGYAG